MIVTPEGAIFRIYLKIMDGTLLDREAYHMVISAFEEIQRYREIGTIEECRKAMDKQMAKKILPLTYEPLLEIGWRYQCPNCGCAVGENVYHPDVTKDYKYCSMCGQAIYE